MDNPSETPGHHQARVKIPAARTFGISGVFDKCRGVFAMAQEAPPSVVDGSGSVTPASLALLADHTIGSAVILRLGEAEHMVTGHIHFVFLSPIPPGVRRFRGSTEDVHLTPRGAFGRGSIATSNGDIVALISSRFAIISRDRGRLGSETSTRQSVVESDLLVAPDTAMPVDLAPSPLDTLLGTRLVAHDQGQVRVRFQATNNLANDRGGLHGGVAAVMADRAATLTFPTPSSSDPSFSHTEMRVVFLRPLPTEGTAIEVDAAITHLGNSTATTTALVRDPNGRLAVQVDSFYTR